MTTIRVGTRGSRLALAQAEIVARRLRELDPEVEPEVTVVTTAGDRIQDVPLSQVRGQGFFVKELESALSGGAVDLAVHSCKDVPTRLGDGLVLAAVPARADPRDCLVCREARSLAGLLAGDRVATSSVRRKALLASLRPQLARVELRGNVDTRLAKLDRGEFEALVVARAALERLGLLDRATETFDPDAFVPAVAQGALAVEARGADAALVALVARLDDVPTHVAVRAERALLATLEGGCQVPLGALASVEAGGVLTLRACVVAPDGTVRVDRIASGSSEAPEALGLSVARDLIEAGAGAILDRIVRA